MNGYYRPATPANTSPLEAVTALLNKSLLAISEADEAGGDVEQRFGMLETLRENAWPQGEPMNAEEALALALTL
jgi:hypothetical protein